jgi:hypothetical protein
VYCNKTYNPDDPDNVQAWQYVAEVAGEYFKYNYNSQTKTWTRNAATENDYNTMSPAGMFSAFAFDNFEFNEDLKAYVQINDISVNANNTIQNTVLEFQGGRLVRISFTQTLTQNNETMTINTVMTVVYEGIVYELPEITPPAQA